MAFQWYIEIIDSSIIEQGDLIPECPIIIPPSSMKVGDEPEIEVRLIDSIILSQSCDLANSKLDIVLVCPYYSLKTFVHNLQGKQNSKTISKHIENLRKGYLPSYHLLNKSIDNNLIDYLVVDFRNVYGIQINSLKDIAQGLNSRLRLLPPYREHLSQAFARFFMRVGLPQDIIVEGY